MRIPAFRHSQGWVLRVLGTWVPGVVKVVGHEKVSGAGDRRRWRVG